MPNLYKFTKRLGQQHWASGGECNTLCGMPMLGNNYDRLTLKNYIVGELKECKECEC